MSCYILKPSPTSHGGRGCQHCLCPGGVTVTSPLSEAKGNLVPTTGFEKRFAKAP